MATPSLAIARAAFTAALIRPDPTTVPRDRINELHQLIEALLDRCSSANIQRCKQWILANALASAAKAAAMGKYFVALAGSFSSKANTIAGATGELTTSRRKVLWILYLFNDLLHECKYHSLDKSLEPLFTENVQKHVADVLTHAASYSPDLFPKHGRRLRDLVDLWTENHYFDASFHGELKAIVSGDTSPEKLTAVSAVQDESKPKVAPEMIYELPATHGDPTASYHELPAANMMPHIRPNSKAPIDPRRVKALQFTQGLADRQLISAVKSFLTEADMIYGIPVEESDEVTYRLDELGQPLHVDNLNGDVIGGESYYGWSKEFCKRMRAKKYGHQDSSRSRSRSRSRSLSRGITPRKYRRSHSTDRSQSGSRSPPTQFRQSQRRAAPSPYRGRRSPRSLSPPPLDFSHPQGSRSTSYRRENGQAAQDSFQPFNPASFQQANLSNQGLPFPFPGGIPLGPNGMPIPPPRPPNWTGPWPPPPPPPPPVNFAAATPAFPGFLHPSSVHHNNPPPGGDQHLNQAAYDNRRGF